VHGITIRSAFIALVVASLCAGPHAARADAIVSYSAIAPENNFETPTNQSDIVAYSISLSEDATNLYGTITERQDLGGTYNSGRFFANLYFGTGSSASATSDLGIEVTNDRAFTPGGAGYVSLAGTGFSFTANAVTGVITFTLPWQFLETDPLGLGFTTVSAANPDVILRLSQSLGYSVAGGDTYGADRLGLEMLPVDVPEPGSIGLLAAGLIGVAAAVRRRTV
jgi:hypothetical protein